MSRRIGILGAGTWGVALARLLRTNGHEVTVWSKFAQEVEALAATHRHPNLPGMVLPEGIAFTCDAEAACRDMDVVLFAVPSVFMRETAERVRAFIPDGQVIVEVAKGVEPDTLLTMTGVIRDALNDGAHDGVRLVALSGPTHAEEVALDMPTSIVSACEDERAAQLVQDIFMNSCMRPYTNTDVLGVELCGALKNIVALAAGIATGLGFGDNTRAALITRGMAEITRLGMAMGCMEQTFSGLAGVGDLIVTATSRHSRNNRCGLLIGQGMAPVDAIREVGMVVEGVNALPAAMQLARRYGVEMPIVAAVDAVVNGGVPAAEMRRRLMARERKAEYSRPADAALGQERVLLYGVFDRMDWRQLQLLSRARTLGDSLTVGLMTDELAAQLLGRRPAQPYEERLRLLTGQRCVDRVLPLERTDQPGEDVRTYAISTVALAAGCPLPLESLDGTAAEIVYLNAGEAKR